jgi:hypothetical protein
VTEFKENDPVIFTITEERVWVSPLTGERREAREAYHHQGKFVRLVGEKSAEVEFQGKTGKVSKRVLLRQLSKSSEGEANATN